MKYNNRYFILQYGNRQWIANEGAHLKIDFLNTSESTVKIRCLYDSLEGVVNKDLECRILTAEHKEPKIIIEKYLRRHNSQKRIGFRAKATVIKVGGV